MIVNHPTPTIRKLMKNANLYAKADSTLIQVYGCSPLRPGTYRLLPMEKKCSSNVPMTFTYLNRTHKAYLDTQLNVMKPTTADASCYHMANKPVTLDEKT